MEALAGAGQVSVFDGQRSVVFANGSLAGSSVLFIAVVADPAAPFPRARRGEVGVEEGWAIAQLVRRTIAADPQEARRPIVAVVDVPGQAYGRIEESLGIHLSCAAAVHAYADARLAGHPVVAFLAGGAMSGAFLAHGYQANRIVALNDRNVTVQAMGKQAAARITRRSVEEVEALGDSALPMSYRVDAFDRLGLVHALVRNVNADSPDRGDIAMVKAALAAAIADVHDSGRRDLLCRLESRQARETRHASIEVRRLLAEQWRET